MVYFIYFPSLVCVEVSGSSYYTPLPFMCSCFVVFLRSPKALLGSLTHNLASVVQRRNIFLRPVLNTLTSGSGRERENVFLPRSDWLVRSKKNKTTLLFCMPKRQHAISCLSEKLFWRKKKYKLFENKIVKVKEIPKKHSSAGKFWKTKERRK